MAQHNAYGPALQMAMFADGERPTVEDIERTADRARELFGAAARF